MRWCGTRCANGRSSLFATIAMASKAAGAKIRQMNTALAEVTEREVTFDMHRRDRQALEFDITVAASPNSFAASANPKLGALLICHVDADIADAAAATSASAAPDADAGRVVLAISLQVRAAIICN